MELKLKNLKKHGIEIEKFKKKHGIEIEKFWTVNNIITIE